MASGHGAPYGDGLLSNDGFSGFSDDIQSGGYDLPFGGDNQNPFGDQFPHDGHGNGGPDAGLSSFLTSFDPLAQDQQVFGTNGYPDAAGVQPNLNFQTSSDPNSGSNSMDGVNSSSAGNFYSQNVMNQQLQSQHQFHGPFAQNVGPTYSPALPNGGLSGYQTIAQAPVRGVSNSQSATPTPPTDQFVAPAATPLNRGATNAAAAKSTATLALLSQHPQTSRVDGAFRIIDQIQLPEDWKTEKFMEFADILTDPLQLPWSKASSRGEPPKIDRFSYAEAVSIEGPGIKKTSAKAPPPKVKRPAKAVNQKDVPESEDEASEASDSDDSDAESVEEMEESPLPGQRPAEALPAVRYDTIKAVWKPKGRALTGQDIREALGQYWDVINTIRDQWKQNKAAGDAAKSDAEKAVAKAKMDAARNQLEMALRTAQEHGHPQIVSTFGTDGSFLTLFLSFMADCVNRADYSGGLLRVELEILSTSTSIAKEVISGPAAKLWSKVMARIEKKGDEQTKKLARGVLEIVEKSKTSVGSPPATAAGDRAGTDSPSDSSLAGKPRRGAPSVAGVKRSLDGDGAKSQGGSSAANVSRSGPSKVAKQGPGSVGASLAATKQAGAATKPAVAPVKRPTVGTDTAPSKLANAVLKKAASKGPSLFASLSSASKKPTTPVLPAAKDKDTSAAKPAEKQTPAAKAFSFRDTMAELTRERVVEKPTKKEPEGPPETPEEKVRRLRKESRRHLRVSWAPDDVLESVREFKSDPSERSVFSNMDVDLNDMRNEGQVLKRHVNVDEEVAMAEAFDLPKEEDIRPWQSPSLIDFSVMPREDREFSVLRGGSLPVISPDCEEQLRRELATLSVHYLDSSDIPPTPREPREEASEEPAKAPWEWSLPNWMVNDFIVTGFFPESKRMPDNPIEEWDASLNRWNGPTSRSPYVSSALHYAQWQKEIEEERQRKEKEENPYVLLEAIAKKCAAEAGPLPPPPTPAEVQNAIELFRQAGLIPANRALPPAPPLQQLFPSYQPPPAVAPPAAPSGGVNEASVAALLDQLKGNTPKAQPVAQTAAQPNTQWQDFLQQFQTQYSAANTYQQPTYNQVYDQSANAQSGSTNAYNLAGYNTSANTQPAYSAADHNVSSTQSSYTPPTNYNQNYYGGEENRRRGREQDTDAPSSDRKRFKSTVNPAKKFTQTCRFYPEGKCTKGADCTYRHDKNPR